MQEHWPGCIPCTVLHAGDLWRGLTIFVCRITVCAGCRHDHHTISFKLCAWHSYTFTWTDDLVLDTAVHWLLSLKKCFCSCIIHGYTSAQLNNFFNIVKPGHRFYNIGVKSANVLAYLRRRVYMECTLVHWKLVPHGHLLKLWPLSAIKKMFSCLIWQMQVITWKIW